MHALCIYSRDPIAAENLSGSSLSILACQSFFPRFLPPLSKNLFFVHLVHETRVRIARNFFFSFHFFFFFLFILGLERLLLLIISIRDQ